MRGPAKKKKKKTLETMCSRAASAFGIRPEVHSAKHSLFQPACLCASSREKNPSMRRCWTSISWSRSGSQSHAWSPSEPWAPGCWCWHRLLGHPHTCTCSYRNLEFVHGIAHHSLCFITLGNRCSLFIFLLCFSVLLNRIRGPDD